MSTAFRCRPFATGLFGCFVTFFLTSIIFIVQQKHVHRKEHLYYDIRLDGINNQTKSLGPDPADNEDETSIQFKEMWRRNATEFWNALDLLISKESLYPTGFDITIVTDVLKTVRIERAELFEKRYSLKWLLTVEGGQKVLFKPSVM